MVSCSHRSSRPQREHVYPDNDISGNVRKAKPFGAAETANRRRLIVTTRRRSWKTSAAGMAFVVAVMLAAETTPSARAAGPIGEWFARANVHLTDLMDAINATFVAAKSGNHQGVQAGCAKLHDSNAALQADMPTPDPNLTKALQAAIDDYDTSAHYCISASHGGTDQQAQQFVSSLADANKHLSDAFNILAAEPDSAW